MKSVCLYLFRWRVFRCLFSTDCPVQKTSFQLWRAAWRYLLTPLRGSQDTKRRGFNDVGLLSKVLRLKNEMRKDITFIGHYNHHHHHHHHHNHHFQHHHRHHCQHHHRHNHPSQYSSNVRGRLYTVNVNQSALPPTSLSASLPTTLPALSPTSLSASSPTLSVSSPSSLSSHHQHCQHHHHHHCQHYHHHRCWQK